MKRFLSLTGAALLSFSCLALADAPDEQFVQYYNMIQEADSLAQKGQEQPALERYLQAQQGLQQLKAGNPGWNPSVIQYRLKYVEDKITPLAKKFPAAMAPKPEAPAAASPAATATYNSLEAQLSELNQKIIDLRTEKGMLELKLKEALSARPAAVDPKELAKAQEQVSSLRKDNDALKVTLTQEQQRASKLVDPAMIEGTRKELANALSAKKAAETALTKAESERVSLDQQNKELDAKLKAAKSESKTDAKAVAKVKSLEAERDQLSKKVEESQRLLDAGAVTFHKLEQQSNDLNKRLQQAEKEASAQQARSIELEAKLKAAGEKPKTDAALNSKIEDLNKRLQLAEANASTQQTRAQELEAKLKMAGNKPKADPAMSAKLEELSHQLAAAQQELKSQQAQVESLRRENKKMELVLLDPSSGAAMAQAQKDLAALRQQNQDLEAKLKMAGTAPKPDTAALAKVDELSSELKSTQAQLKEQQATVEALRKENKKLELVLTTPTPVPAPVTVSPAPSAKDTARIKELEEEKTSLEKQLKAATKELNDRRARRDMAKIDQMANDLASVRSRLDALEAKKAPYTAEELALFKAPTALTAQASTGTPAPAATTTTAAAAPSSQELPSAARALVADAQRAFAANRLDDAEKKYLEVLTFEKDNVFTLANLAAIQIQKGDLKNAEANLTHALNVVPNDAYSLSLLGIIRYREDKFDEAFDLLSRSATLDPKNADTQNYLGITLSQRGQRGPAEAALRKAIQLAPGNASAHHNLAVIYATQNPPLIELARWHYNKALANGHPKDAELEKKLEQQ